MHRRSLLAGLGGIMTTGCLGRSPDSAAPSSPTPDDDPEPKGSRSDEGIWVSASNLRDGPATVQVSVTDTDADETLLSASVSLSPDGEDGDWWNRPDVLRPGTTNRVRVADDTGASDTRTFTVGTGRGGLLGVRALLCDERVEIRSAVH